MPIQISNDVKVGTVIISGESSIEGYLLCNGSLISRAVYSSLFSTIGTTFGAGNGSTTFAIPDLVGSVPRGAGTSSGYTQNITVTLGVKTNDAMQSHSHRFYYPTAQWSGAAGPGGVVTYENGNYNYPYTSLLGDDGNGTPRTTSETRMKNVGVNFFIKF